MMETVSQPRWRPGAYHQLRCWHAPRFVCRVLIVTTTPVEAPDQLALGTRIKLKFDPEYPAPNIPASWNVCPTDPMLVAVLSKDGKRIPQQMRWGLVPWWAKDIKVGFSSINARAETVDTAPAFREAWKRGQRWLVITDGFYEWKKPEKQPYAIAMADGRPVGRVDE
jgi:putative SOS response-associated peptidase YedK